MYAICSAVWNIYLHSSQIEAKCRQILHGVYTYIYIHIYGYHCDWYLFTVLYFYRDYSNFVRGLRYTGKKKRMLETGHPVFKVGAVCRREVFLTALKGRNGVTVQKNHAPPATYKTLQIIGYLPYQLVLAGFFSISQYESPTTPENSHFWSPKKLVVKGSSCFSFYFRGGIFLQVPAVGVRKGVDITHLMPADQSF